jgi:hypothetical protein
MVLFSLDENTIFEKNPDQGTILLFQENFAENTTLPKNFFLGKTYSDSSFRKYYDVFFGVQKSDLMHDGKCIRFKTHIIKRVYTWYSVFIPLFFMFTKLEKIKTYFKNFFVRMNIQVTDSLYIGGFVPMTTCEYTIELEKTGTTGFIILQTPCAKIIIDRKNAHRYSVDSYFMKTTKKSGFKRTIVTTRDGKISLRIHFDGIARTNTISVNNQDPMVTPFYSLIRSHVKYPLFSNGYIKISPVALAYRETSTLLYSITQSAERKLITPLGAKNMLPFGLDGPHDYATVKKGISAMKKNGFRGTIWFDILYLQDEDNNTFFESLLLHDSWEAGIHFSKSLSELSFSEASNLISEEYRTISLLLNTYPKSWCSLRNGDTSDHADYLFDMYHMIWRNGNPGIYAERSIGALEDETWEWWNLASRAGLVYPAFIHQSDRDPAIGFSISYSKFMTWIDNYHVNGITVIPFSEWWHINANSNDTIITRISVQNQTLRFNVKTNGEKALVNVNIARRDDLCIRDLVTSSSVPWTGNGDGSITFSVESTHTYEISYPAPGISADPKRG